MDRRAKKGVRIVVGWTAMIVSARSLPNRLIQEALGYVGEE